MKGAHPVVKALLPVDAGEIWPQSMPWLHVKDPIAGIRTTFRLHVTPPFFASLVTVAANCCVPLTWSEADVGRIDTNIGPPDEIDGGAAPPPQPNEERDTKVIGMPCSGLFIPSPRVNPTTTKLFLLASPQNDCAELHEAERKPLASSNLLLRCEARKVMRIR